MDKIDYTRYFANICNKTNAKIRETAYALDIDIEGTFGLAEHEKIKYLSIYMPEEDKPIVRVGGIWDDEDMIEEHFIADLSEDEITYLYNEFQSTLFLRQEVIDYDELTDDEIFKLCANKSLEEIKAMKNDDIQHQAIRYYFSRLLMNHSEKQPLDIDRNGCSLWIEAKEKNKTLHIFGFSQTPCEGYINVWIDGEWEWTDIDRFDTKEQLQILENLLEVI